MPVTASYLKAAATSAFSALVQDYLNSEPQLKPLFSFAPDAAGIAEALASRSFPAENRGVLVSVLKRQYGTLPEVDEETAAQIESLLSECTFTICTAHQPNLATGYLYFVYKILHAIRLADDLKTAYPDKHFVPVYYMGSEDNDLEELGTFRYGDKKFVWDAGGQTGAVGRMSPEGIQPILDELFSLAGPPGKAFIELKALFYEAYLHHTTIGAATKFLVHRLFGRYGLLVLDPDDAALKALFAPVMRRELLLQEATGIIKPAIDFLDSQYKAQAHPRPINLFYLNGNIRERIERHDGKYAVVNTSISFSEQQLLEELNAHPDRFSPNVILRPLYQETILPDIAFIGGGAEVAYWLELKNLFVHHGVFYPVLLLRQSVLWLAPQAAALQKAAGVSDEDLFMAPAALLRKELQLRFPQLSLTAAHGVLSSVEATVASAATAEDVTLERSAGAAFAKMHQLLATLENKMLRARKKKETVLSGRIVRLREFTHPGGTLQERYENFIPLYLRLGVAFFDTLQQCIHPLAGEFLILKEEHPGDGLSAVS